jgi:hypothetical protein
MSAEIIPVRRSRDPRERLTVQAEPAPKPFLVFACSELQDAFFTRADALAFAKAFVAANPAVTAQVLELVRTIVAETTIREL